MWLGLGRCAGSEGGPRRLEPVYRGNLPTNHRHRSNHQCDGGCACGLRCGNEGEDCADGAVVIILVAALSRGRRRKVLSCPAVSCCRSVSADAVDVAKRNTELNRERDQCRPNPNSPSKPMHTALRTTSMLYYNKDLRYPAFRLVLESHDGRALVPIPKRSTSPRATSTLQRWIV
jgi:hypothetical protein